MGDRILSIFGMRGTEGFAYFYFRVGHRVKQNRARAQCSLALCTAENPSRR
jgi:hypothetical protein